MAAVLPVVTNPTPPVLGTFNQYWISTVRSYNNALYATLVPYDGTSILIGSGAKTLNIRSVAAAPGGLAATISQVEQLGQKIAGKSTLPVGFTLSAQSPLTPIRLSMNFASATPGALVNYTLDDLGALGQTNSEVAAAYSSIVGWLNTNISLLQDRTI